MEMSSKEMVEAIKAHALAHYDDGGWDVIVECWDDEDIKRWLFLDEDGYIPVTSFEEAVERMFVLVDVWADQQADARNSAF
jgi:hypothetical protein